MQIQGVGIFALLICCTADVHGAAGQTPEDCVSRQEFDVLKHDLHYWQNVTLSLLKDYIVGRNEESHNNCEIELNAGIEQKLDVILSSLNSSIQKESHCNCVTELNAGQDLIEQKLDVILSSLNSSVESTTMTPTSFPLGTRLNPAASCKNISTSSPSGNYWIQSTSTGYATMEYCHMSPPCSCSRASGWMRVAELDMTDPQEHCPSGFRTITSPKRMCGRPSGPGCASVTFPVNGVHYSRVCGRIIGYQYASMNAFDPYYQDQSHTIDDLYVEGISLTHGHSPRQHIWTFANALQEDISNIAVCPCTKTDSTYTGVVPPFIGNDYFCDTGIRSGWQSQWYTQDPLWDGEGCEGSSTCCEFNNPPWFCKDLPQPTTDDIELRLCGDANIDNEDSALELINIYVQ